MRIIETLKKQGGLLLFKRYCLSGSFFLACAQFVLLGKSKTALEILRLSTQLKARKKLEKKYRKTLLEIDSTYDKQLPHVSDGKIWVCWLQGLDKAPLIVQKCFASIKKNVHNREIVLLTEVNYREYVTFPDFIQKKIDLGIISGAHMTDLLRLELLEKYGGTWIDATVLCTGSDIPEYMINSELFMFQTLKPGRDGHTATVSNWFITAKSNNRILYSVKELLYEYWKRNNEVIDYFIFHLFFQIVIERYPEEWKKVVPFSNSVPHILLLGLFDEYDQKVYDAVKEMTPFHKLSYKFTEEQLCKVGTYYEVLFNEKGFN